MFMHNQTIVEEMLHFVNSTSQPMPGRHNAQMLFNPATATALTVLLQIITVIATLTNFAAIIVFWKEQALKKPFNILMFNIFLADMMFSLSTQLYIWIDVTKISQKDNMAEFLCAASVGLAFNVPCVTANALSLLAVTVLRYFTIARKYQGFFARSLAFVKVYCICSWIAGIIATLPNFMSFRYNHQKTACYRRWHDGLNAALYSSMMTAVFLAVPLVVMFICYSLLAVHISKQALASTVSVTHRVSKKVTVMLGLLILVFVLCWFPGFVVFILGRAVQYFPAGIEGEYEIQRWMKIAMLFAVINPALDPLIHIYASAEFRAGFRRLCRCFPENIVGVAHTGTNVQCRKRHSASMAK